MAIQKRQLEVERSHSRTKEGLLKEEAYRRLFIRKWMMKGESEDKNQKTWLNRKTSI